MRFSAHLPNSDYDCGLYFRQERVDKTLNNKSPGTSAEGFCLWAESELRSQKFKNCFKKIYEH